MILSDFIQIIVLALIQGITEFLPISSSGHLILVPALTGWKDQGVLTDVVTHVGSLLAVVIYFWRDMLAMSRGGLHMIQRRPTQDANLFFNIAIGTIPIILVGLILKMSGLSDYMRSTALIAVNAIVFGILLFAADAFGKMVRTVKDMNWVSALVIGVAQAFALSPGTSRSGVTMTAARALGFTRTEAARYSFLLSVPANAAASVLVIGTAMKNGETITGGVIMTGVLTFFVALMAIAFLMRMLRTMSFLPFVIYRVILGGALLGLIWAGVQLGTVN